MTFMDKLRLATTMQRMGGAEYTFTRTTKSPLANPSELDSAYKEQKKTETTFVRWAVVEPARAYDIHSNTMASETIGGTIMTGIINVTVMYNSGVLENDTITTEDGVYTLVAKERFEEFRIFEGHLQ